MEMAVVASSVAGTAMSAMGTIAAGNAAAAEGEAARQAAEYKAKQQEVQAGQERAAAQRDAIEERRQGRLAMSRGLALSAAGGGAADPTVVNLMGDLEAESEYRALAAIYGGEDRARNLEAGRDLSRYEGEMAYAAGKARQKNARTTAVGQVSSGLASAGYQGYKMGLFDKGIKP